MKKKLRTNLLLGGVMLFLSMMFASCGNGDNALEEIINGGGSGGGSTAVTEITIDLTAIADEYLNDEKTQLKLKVGDEVTLSFTIKPDELADTEVTLTPDDPTIVSIDGKKVKALLAGTTKVTATAGDKKATCTVTVTEVYAANEYKEGSWDGTKVVFTKQTASSATVVADAASAVTWSAGWYTVTGDVTITGNVTLGADTHLILQDGAKLTIKGKLDCCTNSCNLYIYGQNKGDGKLIVSGNNDGKGIDCNNANIEIHGGDITVQSKSSIGINPKGFKMYGGKLTATSSSTGENAIVFYAGHFEVYGGEVEATSNKTNLSGIVAGNTECILKVFGGKVKGIGGASGKGFNCKLLSGTTGIKFYFSDNGSTWDAGTSYSTATDAQNKRYAKAE